LLTTFIVLACACAATVDVPATPTPLTTPAPTSSPAPTEQASVTTGGESTSVDPLVCTARVLTSPVANVFEGEWAPDSRRIAVSHIVLKPEPRNVTGTDEDQRLAVIDVVSGEVRELGQGSEPKWSASGHLLAYWMDDMDLRIARDGNIIARFRPDEPDVRWVGEELYYWQGREIRAWSEGGARTISKLADDVELGYPFDDAYFSADGQMFTITHYASDRTERRLLGTTATGSTVPFAGDAVRFMEWSPRGHTLLVRSPDALTVRYDDGHVRNAASAELPGPIHAWTSDGRLLLGSVSPTVPAGDTYDTFAVWGDVPGEGAVARLPNLFGIRSFSPDGRFFAGVSRTGLRSMRLEVYRCGATWDTDLANDPSVRARAEAIAADPLHFLRPTSGAYTNYLQRGHTGVDVAAPYGSLIYAAADGVVTGVGVHEYGGNYVCVAHADRIELCDYHISLPLVRAGERVVAGQPVALIGMSGLTTGPHVHWEATRSGEYVDPLTR